LDDLFPEIKSYVISDVFSDSYKNHTFMTYNNEDFYWKHWVENLEKIPCKYFIYMQDDFFLYKKPDIEALEKYIAFLEERRDFSFVRLIANSKLPLDQILIGWGKNDLYLLPLGDPQIFAMQATIWRKDKFLELYKEVKSNDFREKEDYTRASIKLNLQGSYVYSREPKRGMFHYDSSVFPYVATGLIRRKWNTLEYPKELDWLTKKYGIDMTVRGFFNPSEPQEW
jgi:hypothetical protein